MGVMNFRVAGSQVALIAEHDRCVFHEAEGRGYEPETREAFAKAVKPNSVVIDVGAYTGFYSLLAARKGACVLAFEPMPANCWRFGINTAMNGLKSAIRLYEGAASDVEGDCKLYFNPRVGLTTGGSLIKGGEAAKHDDAISVHVDRIDKVYPATFRQPVSVIKVDVEGAESRVLLGARETIERYRPIIFCETLNPEAAKSLMTGALSRYRVERILDGRNTVFLPNP